MECPIAQLLLENYLYLGVGYGGLTTDESTAL